MPQESARQKKDKTNVASKGSNGMVDLMLDPSITSSVAISYPILEKILMQMQRDVTQKGTSDEEMLRAIKGIQMVDDVLKLFRAEGEIDIKQGN